MEDIKSAPPPYSPQDPSQQQPTPIVVQPTQTTIVYFKRFEDVPTSYHCEICNKGIVTIVKKEVFVATHACACILCTIGACFLAWLPYYFDCLKKSAHYCPQCNTFLGSDIGSARHY